MKQKILSISIAAYNVAQYLRNALDSLLVDPSYMEELEVIVVNDGSRDETLSIANEYARKYPETFCVIDKENGGYGSTINASLATARGKYYKLLDGDDWYDKKGLEGLIDFLRDADADLVISPYYEVKKTVVEVPHHPDIPETTTAIEELSLENKLFQMHGVTVKTDVPRAFGHAVTEHCFYTDIEYLFYCFAPAKTIARFNRGVYYYRLNVSGQSVSRAGIQKHHKEHLTVTEKICSCYESEYRSFSGRKKEIMDYAVKFSIYGAFNNYMVIDGARNHKQELMRFDEMLSKKYPAAYANGNASNVVRVLRRLGFRCYGVLCLYMRFKFWKS